MEQQPLDQSSDYSSQSDPFDNMYDKVPNVEEDPFSGQLSLTPYYLLISSWSGLAGQRTVVEARQEVLVETTCGRRQ